MSDLNFHIRRLPALSDAAPLADLRELLIDCVDRGASVGFLAPMSAAKAEAFWVKTAAAVASGERALLVAEDAAGRIAGSVQVVLGQPDNQLHRADVSKLLVHSRARRQGLGARLLAAAEALAAAQGRTLLVLDTLTGSDADRLYARSGWVSVGQIPGYALTHDGQPHATHFYYKDLAGLRPRGS